VKKVMYVIFVAALVAALIPMATAQDSKVLPQQHLYGSGAQIKMPTVTHNPPAAPFFCKKGNCLIYAGDNDTTSPNANGLFAFENPGIGITDAEVWVNYTIKTKAAGKATGGAGNYYTTATAIGTNPTPVQFRTGIKSGNAGKQICKATTGGNAVMKAYGTPDFGLNSDNYWVAKFNKPCTLPKTGTVYSRLTPQYNDGSTIGYEEDNDGAKANHSACKGFKEKQNNSFFNSSSFGVNFQNTGGSSGACGGIGCSGFSWSLNGKCPKA